jgi:hypothetical protein
VHRLQDSGRIILLHPFADQERLAHFSVRFAVIAYLDLKKL